MTENEISYRVRGVIFKVYNTLGPGLLEEVYQRAMMYELDKQGLKAVGQVDVPVIYDGQALGANLKLDILVEDKVIIELKSVKSLDPVFYKQTYTYLKLSNKKLALLVNFNTDHIDQSIKRIVNGL